MDFRIFLDIIGQTNLMKLVSLEHKEKDIPKPLKPLHTIETKETPLSNPHGPN